MNRNNARAKKFPSVNIPSFDWKTALNSSSLDEITVFSYHQEISRFLKYLKSISRSVSVDAFLLYERHAQIKNYDLFTASDAIRWYFEASIRNFESRLHTVFKEYDSQGIQATQIHETPIEEVTDDAIDDTIGTASPIKILSWEKKLFVAFKKRGIRQSTQLAYTKWINKLSDWCMTKNRALEEISDDDVYEFIEYLNSSTGLGTKTIEGSLSAFSFLFKEMLGKKLNRRKLGLKKEITKKPLHVISLREGQRIVNRIPKQNRVLGQLILETGLRPSELLNLRIKDIDLNKQEVIVPPNNGGGPRRLAISKDLKDMIYEYIQSQHKTFVEDRMTKVRFGNSETDSYTIESWESYWVFPSKKTKRDNDTNVVYRPRMSDASMQAIIRTAAKAAGLSGSTTSYSLRNSHAIQLLSQNDDLDEIKTKMGFLNEEAAESYINEIKQSAQWRRTQKLV